MSWAIDRMCYQTRSKPSSLAAYYSWMNILEPGLTKLFVYTNLKHVIEVGCTDAFIYDEDFFLLK